MVEPEQLSPSVGRIDGNNIIFTQSWLNQLGLLFATLLLSAGVVYLGMEFPEYSFAPVTIGEQTWGVPVLGLIPLVLLLKATFRIYNERFVLTPEYLIDVTGRLSWRERSVRLEYGRIQEIEISQTILQRILGLGDVVLVPIAGVFTSSMSMNGLRNPRIVKDIIRSRQKAAQA